MKGRRSLPAALFCAAVVLGGTATAGELVVIDSSLDEPVPGAIIDGDKVLSLPAGASVTLVSPSGRIIRLKGPYRERPDPSKADSDRSLLDALSGIVGSDEDETSSLAVFRGIAGERSDVWTIDVHTVDTHCVRSDRPVRLTRRNAGDRVTFVVERADDGEGSARVSLRRGQRSVAWPSGVRLVDGASYVLRSYKRGYEKDRTHFKISTVPGDLPSDLHRAAWMADRGCMHQARRLVQDAARAE